MLLYDFFLNMEELWKNRKMLKLRAEDELAFNIAIIRIIRIMMKISNDAAHDHKSQQPGREKKKKYFRINSQKKQLM